VLPLDAGLQALLPNPVLPDQRTAVLRFESPQHYTTSLVEVRYPTGNRGGWIQGLEEFFHEHLVPGALITISRGPEPNLFTIVYEEVEATTDRVLTLDEKKNKLGFANVTFYAAVDTDQLPSQQRFGRLNRLKSFPMGERRKAEMILEHVAETMGDQVGSREAPSYAVSMDDLFVAYNVLRPGSRKLLQALITQNDQFEPDPLKPGRFLYTPTVGVAAEEEVEEESTIPEPTVGRQPTRRRYGGRYTDDDE
jgi:predicted DNA-binding transcriptional regulator AlpA